MERSDSATNISPTNVLKRSKWSKYGDGALIFIIALVGLFIEFHVISIEPNHQEIPGDTSNYLFGYPEIEEAISSNGLVLLCFLPWFLIFGISSVWAYLVDKESAETRLAHFLNALSLWLRMTLFSFFACLLIVNIIKLSVGSPRPYFNDAYTSYGADSSDVLEARLSFPSGHASVPMSTLLLLTMVLFQSWQFTQNMHYQQSHSINMMRWDNPHSMYLSQLWWWLRDAPLIGIIMVMAPTFLALYCGCTRITDYKHFAADVLAGFLIGAAIAYVTFLAFYNEMYLEFDHRLRIAESTLSQSPSVSARTALSPEAKASNLAVKMDIVEQNSEAEEANSTE